MRAAKCIFYYIFKALLSLFNIELDVKKIDWSRFLTGSTKAFCLLVRSVLFSHLQHKTVQRYIKCRLEKNIFHHIFKAWSILFHSIENIIKHYSFEGRFFHGLNGGVGIKMSMVRRLVWFHFHHYDIKLLKDSLILDRTSSFPLDIQSITYYISYQTRYNSTSKMGVGISYERCGAFH